MRLSGYFLLLSRRVIDMYGIVLKHQKGEVCSRCKSPFDGNKTFFAFIDPAFHSHTFTVWGAECCTTCANSMQRWGTALRTEYATCYGLRSLGLMPVHLCLVSWLRCPPKSFKQHHITQMHHAFKNTHSNMTGKHP